MSIWQSMIPGAKQPSAGYFPLAIGLLNVLAMVCATKTNGVFLFLFAGAGLGFFLLTAALWALAEGNAANGATLLVVSLTRELLGKRSANLAQGNRWSMVRYCYGWLVSVECSNAWSCRV